MAQKLPLPPTLHGNVWNIQSSPLACNAPEHALLQSWLQQATGPSSLIFEVCLRNCTSIADIANLGSFCKVGCGEGKIGHWQLTTSNIFGSYCFGHLRIPAMEAPSEGCRPTIRMPGLFPFKNLLTPMIVPARTAVCYLAEFNALTIAIYPCTRLRLLLCHIQTCTTQCTQLMMYVQQKPSQWSPRCFR